MDSGPDTNFREVKKIVDCLTKNGYEFEGTRNAVYGRNIYSDDAIADFSKELKYSEKNGNYINDSKINVAIHFEKRADYENFKEDKDGDKVYIGDSHTFIHDLIEENKGSSGGTRRKNKRKTHVRKMKIKKSTKSQKS